MTNPIEQAKQAYAGMPLKRRLIIASATVATLATIGGFAWHGSQPEFVPLYPSLGTEDAERILSALRSKGVPHQVVATTEGARNILVKDESVGRLRLELAERGIPSASVVEGWSLVDREGFGVSEAKHRLNRVRALQGELARTITENKKVIGARVHLAIPDARTLRLNKEKPSASVALKLRPSESLGRSDVRAIAFLVAQSVVGLEPAMVSIIDDSGRLLHKPESEPADELIEGVQEARAAMERKFERDIVRVIEPMVGQGRVVASVSVELNRSSEESMEEQFDGDDPVLRSRSKTVDTRDEKSSRARAFPGVSGNIPGPKKKGGSGKATSSNRSTEVTNYEITKTTRKRHTPAGEMRRVSVAILVDGKYKASDAQNAAGGEFVRRSAGEIAEIRKLAQSVVGFDAKRGDTVEVAQSPFVETIGAAAASATSPQDYVALTRPYWGAGAIFALSLLALLLFARPLRGLIDETTLYIREVHGDEPSELTAGESAATKLAASVEDSVEISGVQNVQLPPGVSAEEALAAASTLGMSPEQALALAASNPAQPNLLQLDSKLDEVLEELGPQDEAWNDTTTVARYGERLEDVLRDLAHTTPEGLAEALTFWMNQRHA